MLNNPGQRMSGGLCHARCRSVSKWWRHLRQQLQPAVPCRYASAACSLRGPLHSRFRPQHPPRSALTASLPASNPTAIAGDTGTRKTEIPCSTLRLAAWVQARDRYIPNRPLALGMPQSGLRRRTSRSGYSVAEFTHLCSAPGCGGCETSLRPSSRPPRHSLRSAIASPDTTRSDVLARIPLLSCVSGARCKT